MFENRQLIKTLQKLMFKKKALVITGARQVGKTTLAKELLSQYDTPSLYIDCEIASNKALFQNPEIEKLRSLIGNNKIIVIDEAQHIENIGVCLKLLVDYFKEDTQIIATGSSALEIADKIFEPMTGRHFLFHLYPMALSEVYTENQQIDLLNNINWHLVYGMYPDTINFKGNAQRYLESIANQYLYKDVLAWKDIRKPDLLDKLLKLLAFQVGSECNTHELSKQLKVSSETIENYIDLLEKSFVIYRLKSFGNNPRKEISKMQKVFFWDNGIRNAIIGNLNPIEARNDAGALWENFIITERVKTNHYNEKSIRPFFWRSYAQQEVDYVETEADQIRAYEMKYQTHKKIKVTKGFTNLYPQAKTFGIAPDNFMDFVN